MERRRYARHHAIAIWTFLVSGVVLWAGWGVIATMGVLVFQTDLPDPESPFLSEGMVRILFESELLWGITGGVMGISLCYLYLFRPEREHFTPTRWSAPGRRNPGPKTEAELKTWFYGSIIGVIIGVMLSFFPAIRLCGDTSLVTVKGVLLTGAISLLATANVLQISLWYLTRRAKREKW